MLVYEDNFGFWDIGNPEERIFFDHVQGQSVLVACERCERPVREELDGGFSFLVAKP